MDEEWPINVLISFGICSTQKESKYVTSLFFTSFGLALLTYKATQWVPVSDYSSRIIT